MSIVTLACHGVKGEEEKGGRGLTGRLIHCNENTLQAWALTVTVPAEGTEGTKHRRFQLKTVTVVPFRYRFQPAVTHS